MSLLFEQALGVFKEAFPHLKYKTEYYVNYQGQKLYFDLYIPSFNLLIEINGQQHSKFVPFMHGTAYNYRASKQRDRLKVSWAAEQNLTLLSIDAKEFPLTKDYLLNRILGAYERLR